MNIYKQALHEIYEEYAGMEGIPIAETACEGYLLSVIKRMKNIAKEVLKSDK